MLALDKAAIVENPRMPLNIIADVAKHTFSPPIRWEEPKGAVVMTIPSWQTVAEC